MGFNLLSKFLLVRAAEPSSAQALTTDVEIGNLDRPQQKGHPAMVPGAASLEVLCNRMSLLGNPFNMKGDGTLRDVVCDAFERYLSLLMAPGAAAGAPAFADLASLVEHVAATFGLNRRDHFAKEWMEKFGKYSPADFRTAIAELREMMEANRTGQRPVVRLLCHCAPQRCHTQSLTNHLLLDSAALPVALGRHTVGAPAVPAASCPSRLGPSEDAPDRPATATFLGSAPAAKPADRQAADRPPRAAPAEDPAEWPSLRSQPARGSSNNPNVYTATRPAPAQDLPSHLPDRPAPQQPAHAAPAGQLYSPAAHCPPPPAPAAVQSGSSRAGPSRKTPPWGDTWGAAGVIALWGSGRAGHVLLVEKRNGQLSFPKGAAEAGDASALHTALREWREETGMGTELLEVAADEGPLIETLGPESHRRTVHYFLARWAVSAKAPKADSWGIEEDPAERDPIVRAHWMHVDEALRHSGLSPPRQQLLRDALQRISPVQRQQVSGSAENAEPPAAKTVKTRWRKVDR